MKTFFITFVLFISFICSSEAQSAFKKSPYLIFNKESNSITILWEREGNEAFEIKLYELSMNANNPIIAEIQYLNNKMCYAIFSDLKYSQKYFYQIRDGNEKREGSFISRASDTLTHFDFYAYGDTRTYPDSHNIVAKQINNQIVKDPNSQTFIVSTGDVVADGNVETDWENQFFSQSKLEIQKMLTQLPYMVSMGNHEGQGVLFAKYFPYDFIDSAKYFYSFSYGIAQFFALDQFSPLDPNSEQYHWLENELKNSKSTWKIVLLHKPGYTAGGHKNNKEVQKYLQPLFDKYGVKLVLAGHNHYYCRSQFHNTTHITTGGGGAPLYTPKPQKKYVKKTDESHHFLKIHIDVQQISVAVLRKDGSLIEEFQILSDK